MNSSGLNNVNQVLLSTIKLSGVQGLSVDIGWIMQNGLFDHCRRQMVEGILDVVTWRIF